MKVNQALILAGGTGSRLGLGTKSHLMYKGKIILEYLIESCVKAGIKHIVVVLVPKHLEEKIAKKSVNRLELLVKKYPEIIFVRDSNKSFRSTPNEVREHLDESKPFFILCGHSPQSSSHLKEMAKIYKNKSIIASGYEYRHDYIVSIGKTRKDKIVSFLNIESTRPKSFDASTNELIIHFPYIIDFDFYDNHLKKDNYKYRMEFYLNNFLKNNGDVYYLKNSVSVSEIDYKVDLPKLHTSITNLIKSNFK